MALKEAKYLFPFLLGVALTAYIGYPIAERQAQWENRTLACWPTKEDPHPKRYP